MTTARFKIVPVEHGDRKVSGFGATCGKCGQLGSIYLNRFKSNGTGDDSGQIESAVRRRLADKGWSIGKRAPEDRCPECERKRLAAADEQRQRDKEKDAVVAVADAPRAMGTAEIILITQRLGDVCSGAGYQDGWTDKSLAEDLGVPRAWVSEVRRQAYGAGSGNNEEIRAEVAEAKALLSDLRDGLGRFNELHAVLAEVSRRADKIEKTIIRIEESVR